MKLRFSLALFGLMYGALTATALSACTAPQRFVATAEVIKVTSDEFVATANMMDNALATKSITPEQYRRWSLFAKRFQASFNLAADIYEAALKVDDKLTVDKAAEILGDLARTLAEFYDSVSKVVTPPIPVADGGAP